ncbi:hypothetical protein O4J56_00110 [Nocardiopsis sp. RSe5-2]|uniref:PH domain-containing protein n=1 Tax=Nocardiopsis endophytica TaxID=3018445 RepID=A0ABT4TWI0_9ACTN|nr:hypothetical protein [Nocardiopsis endophytica]MDA2809032.1 hypothetical protein [Nocardiopsis endophytica]
MSSRDRILGDLYDPGGPVPGASVEAQWVNLRWRRIPTWIAVTTVSIAVGAAIALRMAEEVGKPYIGPSEITGGAVFLVASVVVAVWMVWVAPRVFTRQGVAADAIGIALIQEPNLWSPDRTVRIPWGAVRSITEREVFVGRSGEQRRVAKVGLLVDADVRGVTLPSWVGAVPGSPPVRVEITPGNRRRPEVVQAFREVRPDLLT